MSAAILSVAACAMTMAALSVAACAVALVTNAEQLIFAKSPTLRRRQHCLPKEEPPNLPDT